MVFVRNKLIGLLISSMMHCRVRICDWDLTLRQDTPETKVGGALIVPLEYMYYYTAPCRTIRLSRRGRQPIGSRNFTNKAARRAMLSSPSKDITRVTSTSTAGHIQ